MNRIALVMSSVLVAALQQPATAQVSPAAMNPAQAIAAAGAAPNGEIAGTFEMTVGSTGASGFQVYLNSAKEYHDPGNLTIEIDPGPRAALKERIGGEPQDLMTGKRVRVQGSAKRIALPHADGSTAYQTRIKVERTGQLTLLD